VDSANQQLSRPNFADIDETAPIHRSGEHAGVGPILFRRIFSGSDFDAPIDFVDFTIIPAGSSIGSHRHHGNEELYFIVSGNPLITAQGETRRCNAGTLSIVRDGGWHELINDTDSEVRILVVQVHL
jgi:oxalate decarboxylase/phosphoglucose isomerase-like protein (cupin superfamily)